MTIQRGRVEFQRQPRPLADCQPCNGKGQVRGIFYSLLCDACEGAGLVYADTGEAVPPEEMVIELKLRLNEAEATIKRLREAVPSTGPESYYGTNNRRGPMGTNWTGD